MVSLCDVVQVADPAEKTHSVATRQRPPQFVFRREDVLWTVNDGRLIVLDSQRLFQQIEILGIEVLHLSHYFFFLPQTHGTSALHRCFRLHCYSTLILQLFLVVKPCLLEHIDLLVVVLKQNEGFILLHEHDLHAGFAALL